MSKDHLKMYGIVTRQLFDKDGRPKKMFKNNQLWSVLKRLTGLDLKLPMITGYWTTKAIMANTVTAKGKEIASKRTGGLTANALGYVALGSGSPGSNALGSELSSNGSARAAATVTSQTTTTTNDTVQLYKLFTFTGTIASITEEGLFDASSTGNMGASQTFSSIAAENGDTLEITHKIIFA